MRRCCCASASHRSLSSGFAFLVHEPGAKRALGRVLVVGAAAQPDAVHGRLATAGDGLGVVELQPAICRTAAAALTHERAAALIALPDGALDVRRDVARVGARAPLARARPAGGSELAALELLDERVERTFEDFGDLSGPDLVTEQCLEVAQLVVGALPDCELEPEALRSQRRHLRSPHGCSDHWTLGNWAPRVLDCPH